MNTELQTLTPWIYRLIQRDILLLRESILAKTRTIIFSSLRDLFRQTNMHFNQPDSRSLVKVTQNRSNIYNYWLGA